MRVTDDKFISFFLLQWFKFWLVALGPRSAFRLELCLLRVFSEDGVNSSLNKVDV